MNLSFPSGSETLEGTLLVPEGIGPFPGVLILNGSGPLDRDSNLPGQNLHIADAFAAAFATAGLASFRFDKRGVGASSGDFLSAGLFDEIQDARSALQTLRQQPSVDGEEIVVVGHSVGATVAMKLAATESVAGCVLLAAAVDDGMTVMRRQSDAIAAAMTGLTGLRRRGFLRAQERVRDALHASRSDVLELDGTILPARWFREFMRHDPRADLTQVSCPMLAITGANDVQVEPGDVDEICRLVGEAATGWKAPGLTHLLRQGRKGLSYYRRQMQRPVDDALIRKVVDWCTNRYKVTHRD